MRHEYPFDPEEVEYHTRKTDWTDILMLTVGAAFVGWIIIRWIFTV